MNKLYSQIQNGANFEKLARSFSQSATAKKDGLIGWIHANQLSKEIMEKVLNTNIGSITQPIITGESIIILKVLDKKSKIKDKSNGQKNEEKVSDEEIRNWLYQRKLNLQIKLLLDKLRRDFYIEKKLSE